MHGSRISKQSETATHVEGCTVLHGFARVGWYHVPQVEATYCFGYSGSSWFSTSSLNCVELLHCMTSKYEVTDRPCTLSSIVDREPHG